jgi:transmembrane sensor
VNGLRSTGGIREQARAWVVRLQDAHTAVDRDAFQKWLAKDPNHQSAYERALAAYDASGVLRTSELGRRRNLEGVFPGRKRTFGRGLAVASIAALLFLGGYELRHAIIPPVALETVMLSSGADARNLTLSDGSKVSLAPASEVRIEFSGTERLAEVRKGRVRLSIAREQRPFRIVSGTTSQEATSGIFDAAIVNGQGSIREKDARMGSASANVPDRRMVEFNSEALGPAIERINQVGMGRRIELDPSLADLRVTGVFQRGDSEAMARSLATAFGLKVTSTPSGTLLLTREK